MENEDFTAELNKYTYVIFYKETDSRLDKLSMYTDEDTRCVDLGVSDIFNKAITSQYKLKELPALLYRGGIVYCGDDIQEQLDMIDYTNIANTRQFLEDFVLKQGITVFIKGTIAKPYCKYTKQLVAKMDEIGIGCVKDFDIFTNPIFRYYLKKINSWNTYPMIYINGEFKGGLDTFLALVEDGTVENLLKYV